MATMSAAFSRCSHAGQVPVFGPSREKIPGRTQAVSGGDRIVVPGIGTTFDVIDVPGHTAGHIAYFGEFGGSPVLFCGDTLFTGGCGRLFEGTPAQMWASLSALAALPPETRIYCGHEYTLANLRFALAVEPASAELDARRTGATGRSAIAENPRYRRPSAKSAPPIPSCALTFRRSAPRRQRTPDTRWPTTWRPLPRCVSGRTSSRPG